MNVTIWRTVKMRCETTLLPDEDAAQIASRAEDDPNDFVWTAWPTVECSGRSRITP